jgi:hypothetical protein
MKILSHGGFFILFITFIIGIAQSSSSQGPRKRGTGAGARPLLIGLCAIPILKFS